MSKVQVLGGIKVNNLIWLSTALTLGSLFICWNSVDKKDPAIIDTTLQYPYTIIFRVCMMYSLFIYFMIFLFVKWWLDSSQFATMTKPIIVLGTFGILAYGLFVSCIDRKRINYPLAKTGVFFAGILITLAIHLIMNQLKKIRQQTPLFIGQTSWTLKRITSIAQGFGMFLAVLIFTGQLAIDWKNKTEYLIVISSILFVWTFVYDFKRFKMDVDRISKAQQPVMMNPIQGQQQYLANQNIGQENIHWNGQPMNTFESVQMQTGSCRF